MLTIPHVYWILPGPNRVTITLLPQPGAYFTVGASATPVQSFTYGEIGLEGAEPLRITVHSPDRLVAAQVEVAYKAPLEQPEWSSPAWCHLYFKPAGLDWIWRGAATAGDNSTILTAGAGPHEDCTIAFRRPDRANAAKGARQYPCLDSFRVSLLDRGGSGNMIFRGNTPLAPAMGNQLIDFDTLHETLKLAYFAQTNRKDFPEKGAYVLRDLALLDAVEEKGMLLRELMSFGGADAGMDLKHRDWFPASPATVCASGIKAQMAHWPVAPGDAFATASQGMLREAAARLRSWINKRETLPHIYYVHCSDGHERTGLTAARYLLIHHEESESIPQDADIAAAKWKLTDLFRVGAWALSR